MESNYSDGPTGHKKRVEITGLDDKHQIMALICGTLSGETLPLLIKVKHLPAYQKSISQLTGTLPAHQIIGRMKKKLASA